MIKYAVAGAGVALLAWGMTSRRWPSLPVPRAAWDAAVRARRASGKPGVAGSPFGPRDLNGDGVLEHHAGTDVACPTGTDLLAVDHGVVEEVRRGTSAGDLIRYRVVAGLVSCMHLSEIDVVVGDVVAPGQRIGATGATGRVTGPHLHLELRPTGASAAVDPLPFFPV